ncbi:WecB/TagA/CpsF family glycosyltransferase [Candidatus Roizmanbacteria bacterium]|nr:WecB/TagA/CpsF family glycosyltransferase [Candidatus Roizmanbacteria bacterium]
MKNTLLGITIDNKKKIIILEQIKKYILLREDFVHIVSINPENIILAQRDREFKKIIKTAQIKIIDGVGIVMAAQILGIPIRERVTGVDLMDELIQLAETMRLTVLLVGGRGDLALSLSKCYQEQFPKAKFYGTDGFKDITQPTKEEEEKLRAIVRSSKPNLIFAAFGSPAQELWLARQNSKFKGIVCMGVGQGFDIAGGMVQRAPVWVQKIGFEWLYRLLTQPWRWKRQLKLLEFTLLILKEKFFFFS